MSILRSMYTGVSGLGAESEALGVIGDNIANSNTIGFKGQRSLFEDMLGRSVGSSTSAGAGVRVAQVQQLFTQGSLSSTGVSTDLALSGDGFFVVNGTVEGLSGNFYTRAGQFKVDVNGKLVNPQGLEVQGYSAKADGTMASQTSSLTVPSSTLAPKATTELSITANLDASQEIPTAAFDPENPSTTSNFSTSITVYDSLGTARPLDVYFVKTGDNAWDYHVLASGSDLATPPAAPALNAEVLTGTMTFGADGKLTAMNPTPAAVTVDFKGASAGQSIALNLGTPGAVATGTGQAGMTQFSSASSVSGQGQDGYAPGELVGIMVEPDGMVRGSYTNGSKLAIGQVAVAKFVSNDGLTRAGSNLWSSTQQSGEALVGAAMSGGRASIVSGAVEQSNVDLAQQFVEMIAHNRAFQANSKTITTADQLLMELIQLKR